MPSYCPADIRLPQDASFEDLINKYWPEAIKRAKEARKSGDWKKAEAALVSASNVPRALLRKNESDEATASLPLGLVAVNEVVRMDKDTAFVKLATPKDAKTRCFAIVDEVTKRSVVAIVGELYSSQDIASRVGDKYTVENNGADARPVAKVSA